jgi:hypothetical protein
MEREGYSKEKPGGGPCFERKHHATLERELHDAFANDSPRDSKLGVRDHFGSGVERLPIEEAPVAIGFDAAIGRLAESYGTSEAELDAVGDADRHLHVYSSGHFVDGSRRGRRNVCEAEATVERPVAAREGERAIDPRRRGFGVGCVHQGEWSERRQRE